jgi:hypothetical protein
MTFTGELRQGTVDPPETNPVMLMGVAILLQAHGYASKLGRETWEFAIEIQILRAAGLTHSDLRWLRCKGYVDHAIEITSRDDRRRVFQPSANLSFNKRTCFVLTPDGVQFACSIHCRPEGDEEPDSTGERPSREGGTLGRVPVWDRDRQTLHLGDVLVKHFKTAAPNQEAILSAFEEDGWPPRIDDPIPPLPGQDPKARLHDTINALNRNQKRRLIHFLGDGRGQGVLWELIQEPVSTEVNGKMFTR